MYTPRRFSIQKAALLCALFLLLAPFSHAQQLERKGTLGIQMVNNEEGDGLFVQRVFPSTTASNIGLVEDDLLLSINGVAFNDVYDLVDEVGEWRKGKQLEVLVQRKGKEKRLKGSVVGKPFETSEHGEVRYGHVDFDGGMLRSILELPHGVENPPVLFFLPGVGCGSLDYFYDPNSTIKQFVEALVEQGIAVYRVEKPGMGDSQGTKDCLEMDFNYEVAAFDAALDKLKSMPEIDAEHIFLYGHSLGTISAPAIASQNKVAGIIAWGGISTTWYEYELKIQRDQKVLFGWDYLRIDSLFRRNSPFLFDFYIRKQSPEQLAAQPGYAPVVEDFFDGPLLHGLQHYSYFQTLNEVDLMTAYKASDCPVLALAGEHDIHTIDTKWAADIAAAVNFYRPGDGEYMVLPKTTHHYHTVPSIAEYNELRANGGLTGQYMAEHFNPDVPMYVQRWVKQQSGIEVPKGSSAGHD